MNPIQTSPPATQLLLRALRRHPDRTAFQWDGPQGLQTLSYRGTSALIGRFQAVLLHGGLRHGMRLALLGSNRAEFWCVAQAAIASGVVITWLHPRGSLDDHVEQINDAAADALCVDVPAYAARAGELAARCPELGGLFTLGTAEVGTDLLARAHAAGEQEPRCLAGPDDLMSLNYTGGTTGRLKAAMRRHRHSGAYALSVLSDFELPLRPRFLAVAPITHVSGTKVLPCLMRGGTLHLARGFDPAQVLHTIGQQRIDCTLLVPTMLYMLLDEPALAHADLSSLQLLLYGGSAMSPTRLQEGLARIGPVFSQLYGQTECYPICVLNRADHDPRRPETLAACGRPASGTEVRLLDSDLQPVPPGEPGEICVRSVNAMEGYWQREELTAEAFAGGWLHTGDVARADETGLLTIVDRVKDMIVSGGFNVYSREVEDVLATHPGVAQVAVIGVPDPKWGEAVTAVVVRRAGMPVDEAELVQLVRDRKGPQQAPKQVAFVDTLPTTGVGKVDKKRLRARHWQGRDRMVG